MVIDDLVFRRGHIVNLWPLGYKNEVKICCPSLELTEYVNKHCLEEVRASLRLQKRFERKESK